MAEPYTSTACRVGEHESCGRRIVPNCPCWCHDPEEARRRRPTGHDEGAVT